jgi:hypothetical protein
MPRRLVGVLMACCGCGGIAEEPSHDAGTILGDASSDASDARPDVGAADSAADASNLPRCFDGNRCDGFASCQSGLCCSGTLADGACMCGGGPGCDLLHACCPFDGGHRCVPGTLTCQ